MAGMRDLERLLTRIKAEEAVRSPGPDISDMARFGPKPTGQGKPTGQAKPAAQRPAPRPAARPVKGQQPASAARRTEKPGAALREWERSMEERNSKERTRGARGEGPSVGQGYMLHEAKKDPTAQGSTVGQGYMLHGVKNDPTAQGPSVGQGYMLPLAKKDPNAQGPSVGQGYMLHEAREGSSTTPKKPADERGAGALDFEEMSWDDYNKLDAQTKAAVDANTLLQEAIEKDRALVSQLDVNKDGRIDLTEGEKNFSGGKQGYKDSLKRVFTKQYAPAGPPRPARKPAPDAEHPFADSATTYAPNTLAALNLLGVEDERGTLDEYLAGRAFITKDDLEKNRHISDEKDLNKRSGLISQLAQNTDQIDQALRSGLGYAGGAPTQATISGGDREKLGALVDSLASDMAAGKSFDQTFTSSGEEGENADRVQFDALVDPGFAERSMTYQTLAQMLAQTYGTQAEQVVNDNEMMGAIFEQYDTGENLEEWRLFLQRGLTTDFTGTRSRTLAAALAGNNSDTSYKPGLPAQTEEG